MPRVFVTTDHHADPRAATVLLNEQVASVHLSSGHAASQLIERLAWAISDAEYAEDAHRRAKHPARVVAALVPAPAVLIGGADTRAAATREGAERRRPARRPQSARRRASGGARRSAPAAA